MRRLALAAALLALTAAPGFARTAPRRLAAKTKGKPAPAKAAAKGATAKAAPAKGGAPVKAAPVKEEPAVTPGAKVATFAFTNDSGEAMRKQVHHVLKSKGMKIDASLRPLFDKGEEYRETATALGLVAYVDGEVEIDGANGSATIFLRDGATGLRTWSMTFSAPRRSLAAVVARELWDQMSPSLARACAAMAAKPANAERAPLRIDAGTPLADNPPVRD
jgi:hypothetical protein